MAKLQGIPLLWDLSIRVGCPQSLSLRDFLKDLKRRSCDRAEALTQGTIEQAVERHLGSVRFGHDIPDTRPAQGSRGREDTDSASVDIPD